MNIANQQLDTSFEQAVRFLCAHAPERPDRRKSLFMHSMRVGSLLYENDQPRDVVVAGLLHDLIEWTDVSEEVVRETFGQRVLDIVLACTKDRSIEDVYARRVDMIKRCVEVGKEALVVKVADTFDSFWFYTAIEDDEEIERALSIMELMLEHLPSAAEDPIFTELREVVAAVGKEDSVC